MIAAAMVARARGRVKSEVTGRARVVIGLIVLAALVLAGCSDTANAPVPARTAAPTTAPTAVPAAAPEFSRTGIITFGKSFNTNTLKIIGPAVSFKASSKLIAWSAELSEPAGATTITVILASRTAGGAESLLYKLDVDISDPSFGILANKADLALVVDRKPGTYIMRYLRGGTVLAEGTFRLVK